MDHVLIQVYEQQNNQKVKVVNSYSDSNGINDSISLFAPDTIVSYTNSNIRPYSLYDVEIICDNHDREIVRNVQVFANVYSSLSFILKRSIGKQKTNIITIPEHKLYIGGNRYA